MCTLPLKVPGESLGGPWRSLGIFEGSQKASWEILGGPWGVPGGSWGGIPGRTLGDLWEDPGDPWGVSRGSLGGALGVPDGPWGIPGGGSLRVF